MRVVTCIGCGTEFEADNTRRTRCRKNCGRSTQNANKARSTDRDAHRVDFIGVDGEGVTEAGIHKYVMLSTGSETAHDNGKELSLHAIFEHLWDVHDTDHAYTGFYLGYDFTQWLKQLPESRARELLTDEGVASRIRRRSGGNPLPFPVRWDGWEFDLLAERRFKLRPAGSKEPWLYVNDAGPFYQTSFLNAIDPSGWTEPIVSEEDLKIIGEGKRQRADAGFGSEMVKYNITENRVMADLMRSLNTGLVEMGVRLRKDQWFGPGQAAGQWLGERVPRTDVINKIIPGEVLNAAKNSYYGGWFEIFAHGHVGTLHEYDLNSAYPYAISQLPCLLHGSWDQGPATGTLELQYATVEGCSDLIGAMPHREPDGRIHRPRRTRGWFWLHELEAARRARVATSWEVHDRWAYRACDCPPPVAEIADLYQHRLHVGKNTISGKAAKLVYNSCYGKLAQSVGNPKWANPVYASLVTSATRRMILDAIARTTPENVAMIATDGLYTFEPISLDCDGERLGAWDGKVKQDVTLHMPGMYWDAASRERLASGRKLKLASRGVSAASLAHGLRQLDWEWADWKFGQPWPTVTVPIGFSMISMRQALDRGKWELAGTLVPDDSKTLSGAPGSKRDENAPWVDSAGRVRTFNYAHGEHLESTPYPKTLGVIPSPDDPMTPDGPASVVIHSMMV